MAILSLVMAVIPAAPVLAVADISVSPTSGAVGDKITVEGTGFDVTEVAVDIYFSSQDASTGDKIDRDVTAYWSKLGRTIASDGTWSYSFYVPSVLDKGDEDEDVTSGDYYVYVTYEDNTTIKAVADVVVRGIELSVAEGVVTTEVEINGVGFTKAKTYTVYFDDVALDIEEGDAKVKSSGEFSCTILIPESAAGEHTIMVKDASKKEGSATFTVKLTMAVSPTSGKAAATVNVTGSGFAEDSAITIKLGNNAVATDETDADGSFDIDFAVPDIKAGIYELSVKDAAGNSSKVAFTVEETIIPAVNISKTTSQASPGYVGMDITISGTGFKPKATVTVTYASTPVVVDTVTSDANGAFTSTFKIPKSSPGEHTITATDGTNSLHVAFFMEATPPATPALSLPLADSKAKVQSLFDWGDITDPSGVTYSFQIATTQDFSSGSVVVDKTGLAQSQHTIPEAEKLPESKKDQPYYWRVKATDGAANESGWSAPRAFSVGSAFKLPDWVLYTLIGIGGVALFFVGYFIGRRTAYSAF
jgi:hypothetical protein